VFASFATAHELASNPRRADWLIAGAFERGSFGLLFGDPGSGKSFLALAWSCAIASGLGWLGRGVQAGSVVYVAGEGFAGLGRRLNAWSQHHASPLDATPLFVTRAPKNLIDPAHVAALLVELMALPQPIALVVVDTMARATPGMNEDRASEVGAFVAACDRIRSELRAAVLVLHHSPHSDKTRAKGSIALKGAVDFEAALTTTTEDGVVRLTCTKMKDGEPFAPIFLRFLSVGEGETTSAVLIECEAPPERSGKGRKFVLTANDKLFLLALGGEATEEAKVRASFLERHPSGNRESAAKGYLRARRRGLQREWFIADGQTLTPSAAAIMRDRPDNQEGQQGQ